MARKRNVDAENHLLTGGLITGFLTFMGFLPGAATSAAVTGTLVHNDIQKAKKQEEFKKDFEEHQERYKKSKAKAEQEFKKIEKMLDYLWMNHYDLNAKYVIIQEKIEEVFCGAKTIDDNRYKDTTKKRKLISVEEMIEIASNTETECKTVEISSRDGLPEEFIITTEDEELYTYLGFHNRIPYNFRKFCNEWDIPFRNHDYEEIVKIKTRIAQKLYAPYQFDFSKYR